MRVALFGERLRTSQRASSTLERTLVTLTENRYQAGGELQLLSVKTRFVAGARIGTGTRICPADGQSTLAYGGFHRR